MDWLEEYRWTPGTGRGAGGPGWAGGSVLTGGLTLSATGGNAGQGNLEQARVEIAQAQVPAQWEGPAARAYRRNLAQIETEIARWQSDLAILQAVGRALEASL